MSTLFIGHGLLGGAPFGPLCCCRDRFRYGMVIPYMRKSPRGAVAASCWGLGGTEDGSTAQSRLVTSDFPPQAHGLKPGGSQKIRSDLCPVCTSHIIMKWPLISVLGFEWSSTACALHRFPPSYLEL